MFSLKKVLLIAYRFCADKTIRFQYFDSLGIYNHLSDEEYIKRRFKAVYKYPLNLENPQTFNEKLQWLKLYDRNPDYTMMVDKYAVRNYIAHKLGKQYLIPLLGVWDDPEDIDFDALPEQFVLKCNHNSGTGMCICRDKSKINIKKIKRELKKGLKQDYYLLGREWPYKNVHRKIVAEQYMKDTNSSELMDYKIMCFNGKAKCSFVCSDRYNGKGLKVTFFDREWNMLPFERHYPKDEHIISKPENYEQMLEFAEKLSANIPFVRVDFYEINGKVFFGELTFFPGGGWEEFSPQSWDYKLGEWIQLPESI